MLLNSQLNCGDGRSYADSKRESSITHNVYWRSLALNYKQSAHSEISIATTKVLQLMQEAHPVCICKPLTYANWTAVPCPILHVWLFMTPDHCFFGDVLSAGRGMDPISPGDVKVHTPFMGSKMMDSVSLQSHASRKVTFVEAFARLGV